MISQENFRDDSLGFNKESILLDEELKFLALELGDEIFRHDDLCVTIVPNLTSIYLNTFGKLHEEVMREENNLRRIKCKLNLTQQYINQGKIPNIIKINKEAEEEVRIWEIRLSEYKKGLEHAKHHFEGGISKENQELLKSLYHKIIKHLHPDINGELDERRKKLWDRAVKAWEDNDLASMLDIDNQLSDETKDDKTLGTLEQKQERIAFLKLSIERQKRQINEMWQSFPLILKNKIFEDSWVSNRKKDLEKQIKDMKEHFLGLSDMFTKMIVQNN